MGAHLIVVQCRVIAEGTDGCELHKSIKLPAAYRLLPLPPAERERSAQGLAPPPVKSCMGPAPRKPRPRAPLVAPPTRSQHALTLRPLGYMWYPKW